MQGLAILLQQAAESHQGNPPGWVTVLSALLTPTIGFVAVYIAYQQYLTNKRKLRFDLLDRRLAVFNSTVKLISAVVRKARVEMDDLYGFLSETREHCFLFGPEVGHFIDSVYERAVDVHSVGLQPVGRRPDDTQSMVLFNGQVDEARKIFGKYLSFPEP